ncbi:hypothetical protein O181_083972 [Austropuccinia psidii MF-1]|uniref:Uncharacterized protein n=1 Tax=Austropuccinia psidii MF-1 TaxID=1389203 RepID=A0A9Q3IKK1_9BASI|nr:hypothetical protein [Austropuccinia psidii MF-1]
MSETDKGENALWTYRPNSGTTEESQELWINLFLAVLNYEDQIWGLPLIESFKIPIIRNIPFIVFEDLFEKEDITQETPTEAFLSQLPGENLSKLEFMDIINYDGIKGNLNNDYWNDISYMDSDIRSSLYWGKIKAQRWFCLEEYQIEGRSIKLRGDCHNIERGLDFDLEDKVLKLIIIMKNHLFCWKKEEWNNLWKEIAGSKIEMKMNKNQDYFKKIIIQKIQGPASP